ncbi:MAG: hypothetical protein J5I98_09545 [Phaeodactylibacter sp.]|nr:hypothetical protein [Phaeodactylibacter sp.]
MKRILIIDNEDLEDEISNLKLKTQKKGIEIDCYQFNVGSTTLPEVLSDNRIDIEKVKNIFLEKYSNRRYHLVCFDYELGPEEINGVNILTVLKPFLPKSQFLFYSSRLDKIVRGLLEEYKGDAESFEKVKKKLIALIGARVDGFVDRKEFISKIIEILTQGGNTLDDIFETKMQEYKDYRTEYFDGIKIDDLDQLLQNNDGMSMKYKTAVIEQLVAYLIRLHDDE